MPKRKKSKIQYISWFIQWIKKFLLNSSFYFLYKKHRNKVYFLFIFYILVVGFPKLVTSLLCFFFYYIFIDNRYETIEGRRYGVYSSLVYFFTMIFGVYNSVPIIRHVCLASCSC